MLERLTGMRSLLLFASLFSLVACGHRPPDLLICAAAGSVNAGADCAHTMTAETKSMTVDEFLDFLEPTDTRGGAVCTPAADWIKLKTFVEQLCSRVGCSKGEIKQIQTAGKRVEAVSR